MRMPCECLNVGCGEFPAEGWVNIDVSDAQPPSPDIVASALALPFEDDAFGRIYCGHLLEHLTFDEVAIALREFERVLAPVGELMVVGPDADRARTSWPDVLPTIEGGERRWAGDAHQWTATEARTLVLLREAGWQAEPLPIEDVPVGWPVVSRVGWQFAITARPR